MEPKGTKVNDEIVCDKVVKTMVFDDSAIEDMETQYRSLGYTF
jgi:hypothetical protein